MLENVSKGDHIIGPVLRNIKIQKLILYKLFFQCPLVCGVFQRVQSHFHRSSLSSSAFTQPALSLTSPPGNFLFYIAFVHSKHAEAEFLDVIEIKVLGGFLLAIHSHLY